jgi:hypothetical protein
LQGRRPAQGLRRLLGGARDATGSCQGPPDLG